ncbi:MAG: DUF2795 domain-containing protein [Halothece sp.]
MAVSAVDISKTLGGTDFPASKQDLIKRAQDENTSDEVMNILNQMPDKQYGSMADVEREFGNIK